jgi:predicted Zn-dependent protease
MPKSALPHLRLASLHTASGQREQAEAALNVALELEPNNAAAQAALLDLMVNANRQDGALAYIRRLKQRKPDLPVPYLLEATFYQRLKNVDAAAAAFREGIAKTNRPELAVGLYQLLLQSGRKAEGDAFGAAWMQKHPQDSAMDYALAMTSIARNELAQAEDRLKHVLESVPNHPLALNNLAWVMASRHEAGAVATAQRALFLMPDDPATMDTLAMALAAEKRLPEALALQQRAVTLAPDDGELRLSLARLALDSGDKALAVKELKHLREMGSRFAGQPEVNRLLQGL